VCLSNVCVRDNDAGIPDTAQHDAFVADSSSPPDDIAFLDGAVADIPPQDSHLSLDADMLDVLKTDVAVDIASPDLGWPDSSYLLDQAIPDKSPPVPDQVISDSQTPVPDQMPVPDQTPVPDFTLDVGPTPDAGVPTCPVFFANCTQWVDARGSATLRQVTWSLGKYQPKCLHIRNNQSVTFTGVTLHPITQVCGPAENFTGGFGNTRTWKFTGIGTYGYEWAPGGSSLFQGAIKVTAY
jgi:hypothetical protein